ncbi:hypothetical protein H4R33_003608 [Dimargaris cristalligena]|nr:hypothetical protein H4R33_003608 [Dimargaris cristalligena]
MATNVNQEWRDIILNDQRVRNAKAMDVLMSNPAIYPAEGSNRATLDSKPGNLGPLFDNLMRSIVVKMVYRHLNQLGFDALGNPISNPTRPTARLALNPKVPEAIKAFKPELEWLHANLISIQVDDRSNDIVNAYFPVINTIHIGDLTHLEPLVNYMCTDDFAPTVGRTLANWMPESYVNFLNILMFGTQPRTEPISEVTHMEQQRDIYLPENIKRDLRVTLIQATTYLATQSGNLQRLKEMAQATSPFELNTGRANPNSLARYDRNMAALTAILQANALLAEEILAMQPPTLPRQVLGYCAIKMGFTTEEHLPQDWQNPSEEQLNQALPIRSMVGDMACASELYGLATPMILGKDGKISLLYYPLNDHPVALAIPTGLSTEADIDRPLNPAD